jgi:replicative DNA helicase
MSQLNQTTASQFERLPPHNIEAEMCVLASLLLEPGSPQFCQILAETPQAAFFSPDHQILFQVLGDMHRAGRTIDPTLLREELSKRKLLEEIGGTAYLAQIVNTVPSSAHGLHYAGIIRDKWQLREAICAANEILRSAYAPDPQRGIAEILMEQSNRLLVTAATGHGDGIITMREAVESLMSRIKGGQALFLPTGLADLDDVIIGLPIGGLTLVGADSRTGKSLLLKDIARRLAETSKRVGIIALEENEGKIAANILSAESNVESRNIMRGQMCHDDWAMVDEWAQFVASLPIVLKTDAMTIDDVEAAIAMMKLKHKCDAIMVDHFHLIDLGETKNETAAQSSFSHRIKAAFKRADVAGVLATQINKGTSLSERPNERSIRGTNAQFNDADLVLLLYCEDFWKQQEHINQGGDSETFVPSNLIEIAVNKNKYGRTAVSVYEIDRPHQKLKDRKEEIPVFGALP